jgi:hypothetical protein
VSHRLTTNGKAEITPVADNFEAKLFKQNLLATKLGKIVSEQTAHPDTLPEID